MFVIVLLFFEIILSFGGYFYFFVYSNLDNSEIEENSFRILFLGESTTEGDSVSRENAYPAQFEYILQQKYPDKKIKRYNKGVRGIETTAVLRNLDKNMIKYKPHLVVLMAGNNDNFILDNANFILKKRIFKSKIYRLIESIKDIPLLSKSQIGTNNFRYVFVSYLHKPSYHYGSVENLCSFIAYVVGY